MQKSFYRSKSNDQGILIKFRSIVVQVNEVCIEASPKFVADVSRRDEASSNKLFRVAEMIDDFVSRQGLVIPKSVALAVALEAYVRSAPGEEDYFNSYYLSLRTK